MMDRRRFMQATLVGGAAVTLGSTACTRSDQSRPVCDESCRPAI